jgi:hypothetical protein
VAHKEIVTLFGINIATGFGFIFGRIATERAPEIIQIRFFLCEFLKLRGNP